jgi:predicted DNA-binding protein (UPF0251 family)
VLESEAGRTRRKLPRQGGHGQGAHCYPKRASFEPCPLARLPEDYREVIVLRHLEGLSIPDVARRMGRSAGSVEKLWVRALVRLRRSLGEQV